MATIAAPSPYDFSGEACLRTTSSGVRTKATHLRWSTNLICYSFNPPNHNYILQISELILPYNSTEIRRANVDRVLHRSDRSLIRTRLAARSTSEPWRSLTSGDPRTVTRLQRRQPTLPDHYYRSPFPKTTPWSDQLPVNAKSRPATASPCPRAPIPMLRSHHRGVTAPSRPRTAKNEPQSNNSTRPP